MTTIVGIHAELNGEGVVLASDLNQTQTSWAQYGDVAHRRQTRSEGQKIYVSDDRQFAVAMSGVFDDSYTSFLSDILKGKINVLEAIRCNSFKDFLNLNLSRFGGRMPNNDNLNGLLIATRYDNKPRLHTCWPLGLIEERDYISIGSGSDFALNHIASAKKLIPAYMDLASAVELSAEGLDKASRDIYTGGVDLVVVTPDGIKEYGDKIKNSLKTARKKIILEIKQQVTKPLKKD
jgi:20S proteasome alpha/beta subunit